ncbi:MAG: outer membrane protein assembly factor BamE [Gammaproteobacteria bacterium]|nr:outer membrane protein assembly factor BamE [Gammaproteobacteria bacterium]
MKSIFPKISLKLLGVAVFCIATLILASSCKVPGMHRPSLQQGNLLTQDMVDELEPGMTKEQVEFVLGRPVHLNTFNVDHWDYIYTLEDRRGNKTRRHLSVKFEDDVLTEIGGDYKPSEETEAEETSTIDDPAQTEPTEEDTVEFSTEDTPHDAD